LNERKFTSIRNFGLAISGMGSIIGRLLIHIFLPRIHGLIGFFCVNP
jgi:hypothetical protein